MPRDPLSPEAVLASIADAIPTHLPGDTTSDVGSSYEVLALFVHAAMTNLGFRLKSFDEDHHEGTVMRPILLAPAYHTNSHQMTGSPSLRHGSIAHGMRDSDHTPSYTATRKQRRLTPSKSID